MARKKDEEESGAGWADRTAKWVGKHVGRAEQKYAALEYIQSHHVKSILLFSLDLFNSPM